MTPVNTNEAATDSKKLPALTDPVDAISVKLDEVALPIIGALFIHGGGML
jgi:hypothetical protein